MIEALELGVDALAVYRLTRLVTTDRVLRPLRVHVIRQAYRRRDPAGPRFDAARWDEIPRTDDDPPEAAAFIICPWCVGQWMALGAVVLRAGAPRIWRPLSRALALSGAAGLIASRLDS